MMYYTKTQKEVIDELEDLVGKRFNLKTLNEVLAEIFNEDIKAEFVDNANERQLTDWNIMFNSEKEETYGYFDIYVLKHRVKGFDGTDFYITEIGFEFE